ncbi:MAG: hypothetical protein ABIS01_18185 [Ferruginibacter sp.]
MKNGILMNVSMADGSMKQVEMIGGIKVRFGDRTCYKDAFVLRNGTKRYMTLSLCKDWTWW